jgi:uncharacterized membrane protein
LAQETGPRQEPGGREARDGRREFARTPAVGYYSGGGEKGDSYGNRAPPAGKAAAMTRRRASLAPGLRARALGYRFRESLFFLPALIVLAGLGLALVVGDLNRWLRAEDWPLPAAVRMTPEAAVWFLSGVAGAMITTAGVVFSLTVVSLQLASGQFSPRVLRTFVRDRLSQVVIGTLVATFVYCTLVLRYTRQDELFAPMLPIGIALLLVVVTVILIIAHLDHLARSLQVGEVLRRTSVESAAVIDEVSRETPEERPHAAVDVGALGAGLVVHAPRDGWVNQNPSRYLFAAVPPKTVVRLEMRGGAYVSEGQPLATLWPKPPDPGKATRLVASAVDVGDERTMQEDLDFGLRQLVDIGLRALSPAVNDPTTATEVVLRIGSVLRRLLVVDLPPEAVAGPEGRVLLRPWALNHDEYVAHAFDELRLADPTQLRVATTMLRTLRMLIVTVEEAGRPERAPALERQMRLLLDVVERRDDLHPEDLARVRAISSAETDPADHSRASPHYVDGEGGGRASAGADGARS